MMPPERLRLYLVTDRSLAGDRSLEAIVAAAVAGGVSIVQLREKSAPTRAFIEEARAIRDRLAGTGVPLIVNDRVDVALAAGADGVHLGDDDMSVADARRLLGPAAIIGLSLARPPKEDGDADYYAASPVFATATKADAGPALGLAGIERLRRATRRPLTAIGGIGADNAEAVIMAGADGIAVVSAIMTAGDPGTAARNLRRIVDRAATRSHPRT